MTRTWRPFCETDYEDGEEGFDPYHLRRLLADLLAATEAAPLPPRDGGEREVRLQLIDEAKRYLREELP